MASANFFSDGAISGVGKSVVYVHWVLCIIVDISKMGIKISIWSELDSFTIWKHKMDWANLGYCQCFHRAKNRPVCSTYNSHIWWLIISAVLRCCWCQKPWVHGPLHWWRWKMPWPGYQESSGVYLDLCLQVLLLCACGQMRVHLTVVPQKHQFRKCHHYWSIQLHCWSQGTKSICLNGQSSGRCSSFLLKYSEICLQWTLWQRGTCFPGTLMLGRDWFSTVNAECGQWTGKSQNFPSITWLEGTVCKLWMMLFSL